MPLRQPRRAGLVLATGQTTQYSSEQDDGALEKGLTKRYEILTAGGYSGTSNIDLAHYTGTDIGFTRGSPDTVTSTVLDFTTLFVAADVIVISGATNGANNVARTIAGGGVAANVLTLTDSLSQTVEAAGATVTIAKREAHSNNCVLDLNTGLMWARYVADKMGVASNSRIPWTGVAYDIFAYAAAANTASLGGYTDWRIPNIGELLSLINYENLLRLPDSTAFPSFPQYGVWSSTTDKNTTTLAWYWNTTDANRIASSSTKTTAELNAMLVRGG